ncbi:hypothetical protein P7B02_15290 [Caulobacter segnis]|uniref:hypothetical protein n=1 Tax=Caulobacter segnis TaxID=88688 RepID=UPI0024103EEB|nr:hypothetical protein [Caulobacter segnis]MDG2522899.1 hypothetical protein [Caulobacter segnis]
MGSGEPRRKAHTKEVIREIFAKSGNLCAMPGCNTLMVTAKGEFIGQICHIEGVKGERRREGMDEDELAAVPNLVLLCYPHHVETNNEVEWPVARMRQMKADHEGLFTDATTRMLEVYIDGTARGGQTKAVTVERFCKVLDWPPEEEHRLETADEINHLFDQVAKLDLKTRGFICAVVERAEKVRETDNVQEERGTLLLRWDDFTAAYNVADEHVKRRVEALSAHRLGGPDQMEIDERTTDAIALYGTKNGWSFWSALGQFCALERESVQSIVVELDLSRLDELPAAQ